MTAMKRNRNRHICVVAARSGSTRLTDKNIRLFAGLPLFAHSLRQGLESDCFDAVILTSDSDRYLEIAAEYDGVICVKRPPELAQATSPKRDVLIHAMDSAQKMLGADVTYCTELQPTSPLRRVEDIQGAVFLLEGRIDLKNVVSVTEPKLPPSVINVLERDAGLVDRLRVDNPESRVLELNGAIYAWRAPYIAQYIHPITDASGYWLMPRERSFDIDTLIDFEIAEFVALRGIR